MLPQITCFCFGEKYNLFYCEFNDFSFIYDCGIDTELVFTNNKDNFDSCHYDLAKNLDIIDWSKVDFILISNYEQVHILPFITEYTSFFGKIYITEAAKAYTKHILEEKILINESLSINYKLILSQLLEAQNIDSNDQLDFLQNRFTQYQLQNPLLEFDLHIIEKCFDKLVSVNYNNVFSPTSSIRVYCKSSGYSIGSANWNVEFQEKKIALIGASSLVSSLHSQEFDNSVLENANLCLFSNIQPSNYNTNDSSCNKILSQICSQAVSCLKSKAVAIIVARPFGHVYDILDGIYNHSKNINLHGSQFWFISPVAKDSIQLGNIMGEWLCETKKKLLYNPEYPFSNKELAEKGLIKFFDSVEDLAHQQQVMNGCVIFLSPLDLYSLSFLASYYGRTPNNKLIFIGNYMMYIFAIDGEQKERICSRIYIPPQVETHTLELDTRLLPHEVNRILANNKIKNVIFPSYLKPGLVSYTNNSGSALKNSFKTNISWYSHLEISEIKFEEELMVPIQISKVITKNKRKFETKEYELICNIEGDVVLENNVYTLLPKVNTSQEQEFKCPKVGMFSTNDNLLGLESITVKENADLREVSSQVIKISEELLKYGFTNQGLKKSGNEEKISLESELGDISISISNSGINYDSSTEYANSCLLSALRMV
ncbi:hypothetical protein BB561_004944 [Smittium simulii]|uniref:Cleavage and polyadenylation specificity factor subunit 2 n=1 Tax=Smittium simulii TaxID=133385 RepID=A0A2T9YDC2_9FUNG|nr:hypothetical protein BB561_004944 [Smittium simulii]